MVGASQQFGASRPYLTVRSLERSMVSAMAAISTASVPATSAGGSLRSAACLAI
mgnify:CR=1 FL=1